MIPEIGSVWVARDGRKMRVDRVTIPSNPSIEPVAHVTVLNATGRMKKISILGTHNFSDAQWSAFLRPSGED